MLQDAGSISLATFFAKICECEDVQREIQEVPRSAASAAAVACLALDRTLAEYARQILLRALLNGGAKRKNAMRKVRNKVCNRLLSLVSGESCDGAANSADVLAISRSTVCSRNATIAGESGQKRPFATRICCAVLAMAGTRHICESGECGAQNARHLARRNTPLLGSKHLEYARFLVRIADQCRRLSIAAFIYFAQKATTNTCFKFCAFFQAASIFAFTSRLLTTPPSLSTRMRIESRRLTAAAAIISAPRAARRPPSPP